MRVLLQTVPNALWTAVILVNVFFVAIVQTNASSSSVSQTTKNVWLAEVILSALLAGLVYIQQTTFTSYVFLTRAIALAYLILSILTFVKRSGLSASQQKFAITTFAFAIAIAAKYWANAI